MIEKDAFWKAIATIVIWVMITGSIGLTGIFIAPMMGEDSIAVIFLLLVAAVLTNGFIWDWGGGSSKKDKTIEDRDEAENEIFNLANDARYKRKRKQIGARLSDLSDTELIDLRERLQAGELDDEELEYIIQNTR